MLERSLMQQGQVLPPKKRQSGCPAGAAHGVCAGLFSLHHLPQVGCTVCIPLPIAMAHLHALCPNGPIATLLSILQEVLLPNCQHLGVWQLSKQYGLMCCCSA